LRAEEPRRYPVYTRKTRRTWWLGSSGYRKFAAREFTSVFAAAYSVILLLLLFALSRGPDAYEGFLRWLKLPGIVALQALILVAMLYHAGTWFLLTSRAMVIRLGRRTVPRKVVLAALVVGFIVASAAAAILYIAYL
jgi:fumarate reductase subunit C